MNVHHCIIQTDQHVLLYLFSGVGGQNVVFEYRAEVGLLTRNVVVKGSEDAQWDRDIEACADGFNPGLSLENWYMYFNTIKI